MTIGRGIHASTGQSQVLPQHPSFSPDVRQRFEREAKTISQPSPPRIFTLTAREKKENDADPLVVELLDLRTRGLLGGRQQGTLFPEPAERMTESTLAVVHRVMFVERVEVINDVVLPRRGA